MTSIDVFPYGNPRSGKSLDPGRQVRTRLFNPTSKDYRQMTRLSHFLPSVLAFCIGTAAVAQTPETELTRSIAALESDLDARIGVLVLDTATDWTFAHRAHERFLMASTFKSVLCGAVLRQVDAGTLTLDETITIRPEDLLDYAPVAEANVGSAMTIADLCLATLDQSDNTAANLLLDRIGGPAEVTDFARSLGDEVTRLDRVEPDLNIFAADDPRDTTSPAAMVATWREMLLGSALSPQARQTLIDWMSLGGVTGSLIRASTPKDWQVADKSGAGDGFTRNLVGMMTPPGRAPWLFAIYLSDSPADFDARNEAVRAVGAGIVEMIKAR